MGEHYFTKKPKSRPRFGIVRTRLRGLDFEFLTASGVFSYKKIDSGTRLLIESAVLPEKGVALDRGCGYGPIGIAAAKTRPGLHVYMTDTNARAIKLALENVRRNDVTNITVIEGDLYDPVSGFVFDAIVTNPPITAGIKKVVAPLIYGAAKHLREGGSLQLVVRTNKGCQNLIELLEEVFECWEVVDRKGGYRVLKASR